MLVLLLTSVYLDLPKGQRKDTIKDNKRVRPLVKKKQSIDKRFFCLTFDWSRHMVATISAFNQLCVLKKELGKVICLYDKLVLKLNL